MIAFFKIALVAISLALDVFAVCVGVGVRGHTLAAKIRIGFAFASAEVTMNLIGVGLGRLVGRFIGDFAAYLGFAALVAMGIYMLVESLREESGELDLSTGWGLFIAAVSISLDSLGIGFTLLYIGVPLVESLLTIFAMSIVATAAGLALGRVIGERAGGATGMIAGIILALTGLGFGVAHYLGVAG